MKNIQLCIDLAFCLIFLPLMILIFPVERWWGNYPIYFALLVAWLYATYFLYKYFVIPRLYLGRAARWHAVVAIVVSLAVTFAFSLYEIQSPYFHIIRQYSETLGTPIFRGVRQNQQAVWIHYIIVVFFSFAVGMLTEVYRQRLAREELEYERNKAELALYKAQINPHFLFNTLNTLYGLLITNSDKAVASMERFINMTKYTYANAARDFIALADEVEYIGEYIGLQRLRLNELAEVKFDQIVENPSTQVPPMLFITFVENAFKYGISSCEPCFVNICLRQEGRRVIFTVENRDFSRSARGGKGTGIDNCRRRLSLLYPERHSLECRADGDIFRVRLELQSIES